MFLKLYLDGDSGIMINGEKKEPIMNGFQWFIISLDSKEEIEKLNDVFLTNKLGLNHQVFDSLTFIWNDIYEALLNSEEIVRENGNYSLEVTKNPFHIISIKEIL